ncbi:hypothetical protein [Paraburkholderia unamae]|uniref:Uncharacterized protein n=1 Tax=Paraburkholderia unamae TaxID=219649 RepID=A0ABX5KIC5_9BURK|nr:hypothetical protein [Paraburkholderia unamae]PVX77164.1 hypothetical protein C7402_115223 [Paraburkholderia unamae]
MSSGGTTTSNTVTNPWSGQQPYLGQVFQTAQNTYDALAQNPSASVAGFTPMQQQAMGATQQVANGTNFNNAAGVNNASGSYTTDLLNGSYLNSNPGSSIYSGIANSGNNPYTSSAMNAANDAITRAYQTATAPQTSSAMEASGRYGSGANAQAVSQNQQNLATQLGNTDATLANTMYQEGIQNQLGAASGLSTNYNNAAQQQLQGSYNAPSLVNSINGAATNLYNMGGNQQALNQAQINAPWSLLGNYNSLIQGNYGSSTSATQPYYNNTAGQVIGGLGSAAMLAGLLL